MLENNLNNQRLKHTKGSHWLPFVNSFVNEFLDFRI